jgi:Integron cassette protein VCH_CASS1 chain
MTVPIATLDELQQFLARAMGQTSDRAGKLSPAVLALTGAILWLKDPGPIEVRAANMAWVAMGGAKYLLRYDQHSQHFELRSGSGGSDLLLQVGDETDPSVIMAFVSGLRP